MCLAHLSVGVTCVTSLPNLMSHGCIVNAVEQYTEDATEGSQAQSDSANMHVCFLYGARTVCSVYSLLLQESVKKHGTRQYCTGTGSVTCAASQRF